MKWIRYSLMLSAAIVIIYGFTHEDSELTTFCGVFLFVTGLILRSVIEIFTGKKN